MGTRKEGVWIDRGCQSHLLQNKKESLVQKTGYFDISMFFDDQGKNNEAR